MKEMKREGKGGREGGEREGEGGRKGRRTKGCVHI